MLLVLLLIFRFGSLLRSEILGALVNRCRVGKGCRDRLPITPCKGWADPSDGTGSMFEQRERRGGEPILFPEKKNSSLLLVLLVLLIFCVLLVP